MMLLRGAWRRSSCESWGLCTGVDVCRCMHECLGVVGAGRERDLKPRRGSGPEPCKESQRQRHHETDFARRRFAGLQPAALGLALEGQGHGGVVVCVCLGLVR